MAFVVTDNFNRADANPIGGAWVTVTSQGAMQLLGNVMTPASVAADSAAYYNLAMLSDNQYAQCKVTVNGTSSQTGIGPMIRCSTTAATFYRVAVNHNATNNIALGKLVNNTFTSIWQRTATFVDGDTVRVEAIGTTLRVLINGVAVGADATDSSITGGRAGVIYSSATTSASVDDWEAGNLNNCPGIVGVGAAARGTGATTAPFPTNYTAVDNDVCIVYQECEGTDNPAAPTNYGTMTTSPVTTGTTTKLTAFWRRLVAGDTAPSVPDPGDHENVFCVIVRGCAREGNPWDFFNATQELTADTTVSIAAGTSNFNDTLCLAAFSTGQDTASTAGATAWADSSLISVVEIMDNWQSQSGLGGGFGVAKGDMLGKGAINAMTATLSLTANFKAQLFIALRPDTTAPLLVQARWR